MGLTEEPRRGRNPVDEESGGEVLVKEVGLVLDLVDDPLLPLEHLHEQLLHRRHLLCFTLPSTGLNELNSPLTPEEERENRI